jgi:hypothetical protein
MLLLILWHSYYRLITFEHDIPLAYNVRSPILLSEIGNKSGERSSIYPNSYMSSGSNVQEFVAEIFCLYLLLIMRSHSSELLKKYSISTWADLFSFSQYCRLLLTYGMWRRLLVSSQKDCFLDGLPFLSFSSPSTSPGSRSLRFHFSPWKCTGFKRWLHSMKVLEQFEGCNSCIKYNGVYWKRVFNIHYY